jgi:hypothetical protein
LIFLRLCFAVSFAALLFSFPSSYRRWTHPFIAHRIQIQIPPRAEWDLSLTNDQKKEIEQILAQPFYYLGKGLQTFAFESEDGRYVIKFFRFDDSKMPYGQWFLRWVKESFGLATKPYMTPLNRTIKTFRSCLLSYHRAKEETGLVWIQLNPKEGFWPKVQVRDRIHRWHRVDLKNTPFIVQKRAERLLPTLLKAAKENPDRFRRLIQSYVDLHYDLDTRGLYNLDLKMASNFGFIGDRAMQIDFGNFVESSEHKNSQIQHFMSRFRGWLGKRVPEGLPILEERIKEKTDL